MSTLQRGRGAGPQSGTAPQRNGVLAHPSLFEGVTMAWVGAQGLAQLWMYQSRPQIWQEWKGGDKYPGREGRGGSSGIIRASEKGQRAEASNPGIFFPAEA